MGVCSRAKKPPDGFPANARPGEVWKSAARQNEFQNIFQLASIQRIFSPHSVSVEFKTPGREKTRGDVCSVFVAHMSDMFYTICKCKKKKTPKWTLFTIANH